MLYLMSLQMFITHLTINIIGDSKMSKTNFNWDSQDILITYDLSDNRVSATEIADASNGVLHTYVTMNNDSHKYLLPNTTLWYSGSKDQAKSAFITAFNKAKPSYTSCTINRLLITEVGSKSSYIED